ncbi:hypothetical protein P9112_005530 [Eukaryota sp. TZLM1-RC]
MSIFDPYREKDNGIVPPWIFILQTLNLIQLIVFGGVIAGNTYIAISLITLLASAHAAYYIFIAVNSVVVILMYYTHWYFYFNARRFWNTYDWDFYLISPLLVKILFFIGSFLIPLLVYPFLILASIFDEVTYPTANETFATLFFVGNLPQTFIVTTILTRAYIYGTGSRRLTTYLSVVWKNILAFIYGTFLLIYGIFTWIWDLDVQEEETTEFVIASIAQYIVWLSLFAWHATFFVELSRLDADKRGRLRD